VNPVIRLTRIEIDGRSIICGSLDNVRNRQPRQAHPYRNADQENTLINGGGLNPSTIAD
jgi:hypothetical protein